MVGIAGTASADGRTVDPYDASSVRSAVRSALEQLGGPAVGPGPLAGLVPRGSRVLVKPNWVMHRNQGPGGMDCLVTHPVFLRTIVEELAGCGPGSIVIGDAPIQGCRWGLLVTGELEASLRAAAGAVPLEIVDFRRTVLSGDGVGGALDRDARGLDRFVLFDLGTRSFLEPVSGPDSRFRVAMYDHRILADRHRPGTHQYLVAREAVEADVIVSLPKLKTHRKAGITGALKNLVGIVGNKEFLPHHRKGGSAAGGDCYPGRSVLKSLAELLTDQGNMRLGHTSCAAWRALASCPLVLERLLGGDGDIDGGWAGNDTVWRTVLDIDRIALHGCADGSLSSTPVRRVLSITDAIVCGQGNGPLSPEPLLLGCVTASDSPVEADLAHCALLGIDPSSIPCVREARAALAGPSDGEMPSRRLPDGIPRVKAVMPPGWRTGVR